MMTGADLRIALAQLRIPQKTFAEMIGYRQEQVSRWARDHNTVPRNVALIISLLLEKQGAQGAAE